MKPRQLNVAFAFFPYSGNGAGAGSEVPDIRNWMVETVLKIKKDPRIDGVFHKDWNDTPAPMVRNDAVAWARNVGADVLVMIDSDNKPDVEVGIDPAAKPFWDSSFNHLYGHFDKGPCMIGAPYTGGPPHENVFVFRLATWETGDPNKRSRLEQYGREEAEMLGGIQECAALPTGCVMIDMRLFELLAHPYFEYEYEGDGPACETCGHPIPGPRCKKASTEDVFTTRNMLMNTMLKLGYCPILCNWDSWAGHWKGKLCRKPRSIKADGVEKSYRDAVLAGNRTNEQLVMIGAPTPFVTDEELAAAGIQDTNGHAIKQPRIIVDHPTENREINDAEYEAALWAKANLKAGSPYTISNTGFINVGFKSNDSDLNALIELGSQVARRSMEVGGYNSPRAVEIGSWCGGSSLAILAGLKEARDPRLYCVDTWQGSDNDASGAFARDAGPDTIWSVFKRNCRDALARQQIWPLRMRSGEAAMSEQLEGAELDLVYIDAGHTYGEVLADLKAWWSSVGPTGIIAGHDYGNEQFPGVKRAVDEYFGDKVRHVPGTYIWFVDRYEPATKVSDGSELGLGSPSQPAAEPSDSGETEPAGTAFQSAE